ncbi:MAG: TRAP transporter small permease [Saprospiraceae bacterium]|nr:TRAP transporter small permease [Saprospiraceae bacterium]
MQLKRGIGKVLKYGVLLSTYALVASVVLQIFARFFLTTTPPWTEAASRLFFIYSTAFAAGLALQHRYYVHLDVFFELLPKVMQKWLRLFIPLFTLLLFGLMTIYSITFIVYGHREFSPSMGIRMSYVFASTFILGASVSYYALLQFATEVKNWNK